MFKRFQTDVDEPNRQGGIFRSPVYNQTGCVRDALGRTNLTVRYNDRATSYLLDIRGSTENAVGKFECSVIAVSYTHLAGLPGRQDEEKITSSP